MMDNICFMCFLKNEWQPFCFCLFDPEGVIFELGTCDFRVQHTQITLKSVGAHLYSKMPLGWRISHSVTSLYLITVKTHDTKPTASTRKYIYLNPPDGLQTVLPDHCENT